MNRRSAAIAAVIVFGIAAAWVLFVGLPRWSAARARKAAAPSGQAGAAPAADVRKITAPLFYRAEDGMALGPIQREVLFGATPAEQARAIIDAQPQPATPQVSAIPAGVTLRDI